LKGLCKGTEGALQGHASVDVHRKGGYTL
jgi:hypothetical protein